MKQANLMAVLFLLMGMKICSAQTTFEGITYRSSLFGPVFSQKGQPLKVKDLKRITADYPEAYQYMEKASTNNDLSNVFGFIGGALVGWPLGTAAGGGDPNWTLAAFGGGLIAISIPFSIGFKKNAIKGAELYNEKRAASSQKQVSYQLTASSAGIGISFSF